MRRPLQASSNSDRIHRTSDVTEVERLQSGGTSVDVPMLDARSAKMGCVVGDVGTEERRHDAAAMS